MEIKTVGVACDHAGYPLMHQWTILISVTHWPRVSRAAKCILVSASVVRGKVLPSH